VRRGLLLGLVLLAVPACAVAPAAVETPTVLAHRAYLLPSALHDADTLCIQPPSGGRWCRRIGDVRAFLAEQAVAP
jgi:hypothetical protein